MRCVHASAMEMENIFISCDPDKTSRDVELFFNAAQQNLTLLCHVISCDVIVCINCMGYLVISYRTIAGNFCGSKFSWFGELRRFRGFIFSCRTYSNHSIIQLKFSNLLWISRVHEIHKNLNPTKITNHTVLVS